MNIAYIAFGSNLEQPEQQVRQALAAVARLGEITATSSFYRSLAIGPGEQPDYLNGVVALRTILTPWQLLSQLQAIENQQGRKRLVRWGPRTLDLDILLFNNQTLAEEQLTIPHPRILERNFVLVPLLEIAPHIQLPSGEKIQPFQQQLGMSGLEKWAQKG